MCCICSHSVNTAAKGKQSSAKQATPDAHARIPASVERMVSYGKVDASNSELLWWKGEDERLLMFMLPVSLITLHTITTSGKQVLAFVWQQK
jgi:hypothetical protein